MASSWTGGQYSAYRALFGLYLGVHFSMLLPYAGEVFAAGGSVAHAGLSPLYGVLPNPLWVSDEALAVSALLVLGALCGLALAIGWWDRVAALLAALILGWLFQRNPLIANPSLPLVGWLLVLHVFVPARPYGSLAGRINGTDPDWRLPSHLFAAVWIMLALSYCYSGWTKLASPSWTSGETIRLVLENPLARDHLLRQWVLATPPMVLMVLTWLVLWVEVLFAPLALVSRFRPWIWLAMLLAQFGFLMFLNFADLTLPMLLVHLLTFDPSWIARHERRNSATVLFDGACAFCHASVRFAVHEDLHRRLRFAPLDGATASTQMLNAAATNVGDSIVVIDGTGTHALKSRAVVAILERLGGLWLIVGWLLATVPQTWADRAYDLVGRWRYRLGSRTARNTCPTGMGLEGRMLP